MESKKKIIKYQIQQKKKIIKHIENMHNAHNLYG